MYGVYLFADTDKHEQNQHPDTPGQSESVLIVELIDPTKLISRYSAKSPRYCSPTPPVLPLLALFRLHPGTGPPDSSPPIPLAAPPRRPAPPRRSTPPSAPGRKTSPAPIPLPRPRRSVHVHGARLTRNNGQNNRQSAKIPVSEGTRRIKFRRWSSTRPSRVNLTLGTNSRAPLFLPSSRF